MTQSVMLKTPCSTIKGDNLSLPILEHILPVTCTTYFFSGILTPCSRKALEISLHVLWAAFAGWWLCSPFANATLLQKLIASHPMEN